MKNGYFMWPKKTVSVQNMTIHEGTTGPSKRKPILQNKKKNDKS